MEFEIGWGFVLEWVSVGFGSERDGFAEGRNENGEENRSGEEERESAISCSAPGRQIRPWFLARANSPAIFKNLFFFIFSHRTISTTPLLKQCNI